MKRLAMMLVVACSHPAELPFAAFRDATGGAAWDRVGAIESHANVTIGGLSGTLDSLADVKTGRSRVAIAVGGVAQSDGWDGTSVWEKTPGGEIVVKDAPAAVAEAKTNAWLDRRGYFRSDHTRYTDLGSKDGLHGVEATPDGGAPIALYFDGNGLLVRTVGHSGTDTVTTEMSDYRTVGDVKIPFHVSSEQGDPRNRLVIDVTAAKLVAAPDATAFAAPKLDSERITFASGEHATVVPFDLINNHIYIHASVDGQPVRMLVDTGGLNMLTPAAAKRLGITVEGKLAGNGVGAEKVDVGFGHGKSVTVGDATLANPIFYVIDIGKLADVEGEDFDGLVGFELFSRLRVRIDYPAGKLTLTAPDAFTPPQDAIAVPFEMDDRTPVVQGSIDGVAGRMWIDTGSRVSLTTTTKFTHDHDLAGKYKPPFETVSGWGVGGSTTSAPVRFHEVKIGDAAVHDVVGDLFTGDKGSFANPNAAGNIGGGILHRFVVTFDYATKVMYLERRSDEREVYDRSGLFVIRDGSALRVISVAPHTPAEAAGLRTDDRITAIDDKPVADVAAVRTQLHGAVGTKLRVRTERAGEVSLTLAELVP